MNGELLPPQNSRKTAGHAAALALALTLPLLCTVTACHRQAADLEVLAEFTFQDFEGEEPVSADLPLVAGQTFLVRVEAFEADVTSSLSGRGEEILSVARLPYLRAGPVFHVIETRSEDKPTGVAIRPQQFTRNARISVTVFAVPAESRRDLARIEAYRAYEAAIQATDDESAEVWRERANMLRSAASGFNRLGHVEEQLWAEYMKAYVHYFPLAEYSRAAELARSIQKRARQAAQPLIELMATQLEGQAQIERDEGDTPEVAQERAERGQLVLQRAVELAEDMGYRYEQAFALNSRGIGYFYQDRYAEAEQQYRQALEIALEIQDSALPQQVRGNLALVRERLGDLHGALAELQALNTQLLDGGATTDLAHNWSELGRLYRRLHLFPEAIEALHRALALWRELNSAEGSGRSALALAYAYQAIGNPQTARSLADEAIDLMQASGYGRGLREAFALLASLHRSLGEYAPMSEARERQAAYLSSALEEARYQYELGLDLLAAAPEKRAQADEAFAEAARLAEGAGDSGLRLRARLQRCVNTMPTPEAACTPESLEADSNQWLATAPISEMLEARFLMARNLLSFGDTATARRVLDELVSDIQTYRTYLPGVLGNWYGESRAHVFELLMALALSDDHETENQPAKSLAAFNRILNTSLAAAASGPVDQVPERSGDSNRLRELVAQLEGGDPDQTAETRRAIDRELLALGPANADLSVRHDWQQIVALVARLSADSALLAYYLAEGQSWLWVGMRGDVHLYPLGDGVAIRQAVAHARSGLRLVGYRRLDDDLSRAGELLLGPVEQALPRTIYLVSVGDLAGFPFETIRRKGRFLGQDHDLINVLSLQALEDVAQAGSSASAWQKVFIAGNPESAGDGLAALPASKRELGGVAELFDDSSVSFYESDRLQLDLFRGSEFLAAGLIHLATHAQINLAYPELSRLMLSANLDPQSYLTPLDLRHVRLDAELVVLSACETTGVNTFSFDSNLGFIPAFLQSGAGAVVASLWPVADAFAADFMLAFYAAIQEGANAPQALAMVKRRYIADHRADQKLDWPAFQIYTN